MIDVHYNCQDELSLLTRTYLVQELDKSFAERRQLISVAHKLDSEIAQLERDKSGDLKEQVIESGVGISKFKPPKTRKRRISKPDLEGVMPSRYNKVLVHTQDVERHFEKMSSVPEANSEQSGTTASLLIRSIGHNVDVAGRTVNGDLFVDRPVKPFSIALDGNRTGPAGQWVRVADNRPGSSSSTDSAESVRNLEQGACVSNFDPYTSAFRNGSQLVAALIPRAIETTKAFPGEEGMFLPGSGLQGSGIMAISQMASSRVSFPSSRTELEQYKLMVHGSANVSKSQSMLLVPSEPKVAAKKGRKRASDPGSENLAFMQNAALGSFSSLPSLVAIDQSAVNSNRSAQLEDMRQCVHPVHIEGIKVLISLVFAINYVAICMSCLHCLLL